MVAPTLPNCHATHFLATQSIVIEFGNYGQFRTMEKAVKIQKKTVEEVGDIHVGFRPKLGPTCMNFIIEKGVDMPYNGAFPH